MSLLGRELPLFAATLVSGSLRKQIACGANTALSPAPPDLQAKRLRLLRAGALDDPLPVLDPCAAHALSCQSLLQASGSVPSPERGWNASFAESVRQRSPSSSTSLPLRVRSWRRPAHFRSAPARPHSPLANRAAGFTQRVDRPYWSARKASARRWGAPRPDRAARCSRSRTGCAPAPDLRRAPRRGRSPGHRRSAR